MRSEKRRSGLPRDPWKRKMGPEFSGLERPSDFLAAIAIIAAIVIVGLVIAWLASG